MFGYFLFKRHSKLTRRVCSSKRTAPRHVPSYKALGICFLVCAFTFVNFPAFSETLDGEAGELTKETLLYRNADSESEALGKIPKGAIFTFLGEKENGFAKIKMELEGDEEIEGWIDEKLLKEPKTINKISAPEANSKKLSPKSLKRGAVPKDEALLLRREPSFLYGLYLGPTFNFLSHQFGDGTYSGVGFNGGGFLGFYIDKEITLRGEVGYANLNGAGSEGNLSFGLLDIGLAIELAIDRLLLYGSLRYNFGMGIGDIPRTVAIATAADLNSLWVDLGAGYKFPINEVTNFIVRGRYSFSFLRSPVAFQNFGVLFYLEIAG